MIGYSAHTINTGLSAAMTVATLDLLTDIMFYVNLVLLLCALIELAALIVLYKKTTCASVVGLAAVILAGFGIVLYIVQLVMYVRGLADAIYAVYLCLAVLYCAFVVASTYCFMLSRNSHKPLCIAAGVCNFVPPIGAILVMILSYRIRRDTTMHTMVFNGYAYTYAALGAFCAENDAVFADSSGNEKFDTLTNKQAKRKLKALKASAISKEGRYEYAAALINYTPDKYKKALKLLTRCADENYAPALFNLGYCYDVGAFVKKDNKKARAFYEKAIAAGDADAGLRLAILDMSDGRADSGVKKLKDLSQDGNIYAKYNMGVCYERGLGFSRDVDKALTVYNECADAGLFTAQKRIFAMASADINSAQNGAFFRKVTDREFFGTFGLMIKGLIEIKKRHAADAADYFLLAVKRRDKWEGFARCLVGTLYIDCGKMKEDKQNGAEYIKSAFDMLPQAKDIYSVVPRSIVKGVKSQGRS